MLLWFALVRLRGRAGPPRGPWIGEAELARVYLRLDQLLKRRGYPRGPGQTPLEYLAYLEQYWVHQQGRAAALPLVRRLTETFVAARYGPDPVAEETVRAQTRRTTLLGRRSADGLPGAGPR